MAVARHKPLYFDSFGMARRHDELDAWRESHSENIRCNEFIVKGIQQNHDGLRLGGDVAGDAIAEFGFDRVNMVLANTIQLKDWDGRISTGNKEWAKGFHVPRGIDDPREFRRDFLIDEANPGLVDIVTNHARQAWDALRLFGVGQCDCVRDFETVAGRVLVLKPETLLDEYKTPESQLFKAERGFGCVPTASGRAIFGEFLVDGEQARFNRQDFLGVLKPEHIPAWAAEKMAEPEPGQAPEEFEDAAMGEGAGMQFHGM